MEKIAFTLVSIKLVPTVRHCLERFSKLSHPKKSSKRLHAVEEKIPVASNEPLELELQHFIKSQKERGIKAALWHTEGA